MIVQINAGQEPAECRLCWAVVATYFLFRFGGIFLPDNL